MASVHHDDSEDMYLKYGGRGHSILRFFQRSMKACQKHPLRFFQRAFGTGDFGTQDEAFRFAELRALARYKIDWPGTPLV
jgi:hypothetical protein